MKKEYGASTAIYLCIGGLLALGCSGCVDYGGAEKGCVPRAAQACECPDGGLSWQVCQSDARWGECLCEVWVPDPDDPDDPVDPSPPELLIRPDILDFSSPDGERSEQRRQIRVANIGGSDAVFRVNLEEDFEVDQRREFSWEPGAAPEGIITLAPDDFALFGVLYRAQDDNNDTGRISFVPENAELEPIKIEMVADGSLPDISGPREVLFGRAPLGRAVTRDVEFSNSGDAPLILERAEILDSEVYSLCVVDPASGACVAASGDNFSLSINKGETVTVRVVYEPQDGGDDRARLRITSNDPDEGTFVVSLVGGATEPCLAVDLPDDALFFEETAVSTSSRQFLEVRNCSVAQELAIGALRISGDTAFTATQISPLPDSPLILQPGQSSTLEVIFAPRREIIHRGFLDIISNDPENSPYRITLTGEGVPFNNCPVPILEATLDSTPGEWGTLLHAPPLDSISLNAGGSFDPDFEGSEGIANYEFSVVERPNGSTSPLVQQDEDPTRARMFLDLVGTYQIDLKVTDVTGVESCTAASVIVRVVANEDIHVQLVWHTPADLDETDGSGTDLDLHLQHPRSGGFWDVAPWDCYWSNESPNWGSGITNEDDPSLDIDDTNGAGPENINLNNPEAVAYRVGVYYFGDSGFGPSEATVRIFLGGVLAFEIEGRELRHHEFWDVAEIDWERVEVRAVDRVHDGYPVPGAP